MLKTMESKPLNDVTDLEKWLGELDLQGKFCFLIM